MCEYGFVKIKLCIKSNAKINPSKISCFSRSVVFVVESPVANVFVRKLTLARAIVLMHVVCNPIGGPISLVSTTRLLQQQRDEDSYDPNQDEYYQRVVVLEHHRSLFQLLSVALLTVALPLNTHAQVPGFLLVLKRHQVAGWHHCAHPCIPHLVKPGVEGLSRECPRHGVVVVRTIQNERHGVPSCVVRVER